MIPRYIYQSFFLHSKPYPSNLQPLVRSIACWTLGRYASWTTQPISDEHKQNYFIPTMEGVSSILVSFAAYIDRFITALANGP